MVKGKAKRKKIQKQLEVENRQKVHEDEEENRKDRQAE